MPGEPAYWYSAQLKFPTFEEKSTVYTQPWQIEPDSSNSYETVVLVVPLAHTDTFVVPVSSPSRKNESLVVAAQDKLVFVVVATVVVVLSLVVVETVVAVESEVTP
jgi:hypothetical protein